MSVYGYKELKRTSTQYSEELDAYQHYLTNLFINPLDICDVNIFEYMFNNTMSKISVFIPKAACGACAINLIQTLSVLNYNSKDVEFYFSEIEIPVLNEIKIHGYKNYTILDYVPDDAIKMLLLRVENDRPVQCLSYYDENPYILSRFLQ